MPTLTVSWTTQDEVIRNATSAAGFDVQILQSTLTLTTIGSGSGTVAGADHTPRIARMT